MASIKFVDGDEREFLTAAQRIAADPEAAARVALIPESERVGGAFTHHSGSDSEPQLTEHRFPADHTVKSHAHDQDEIMLITEGWLTFGRRWFGVGSSVYIPRMTLYSFQVAPDGVTVLNFRPRRSVGAIFREDFHAVRDAERAAGGPAATASER
jgi:hypothetical protein